MMLIKSILPFLIIAIVHRSNAQAISLRFGRGFTPADHVALRYEHWTNSSMNLSGGAFMEKSRKNLLDLSSYGVELLTDYASNREGYESGVFGFRASAGVSWQIEKENWVYNNWSVQKRSAFGMLAELGGEWFMTQHFTLRSFLQQRLLFNSSIGRYRFTIGLGLTYHLNAY